MRIGFWGPLYYNFIKEPPLFRPLSIIPLIVTLIGNRTLAKNPLKEPPCDQESIEMKKLPNNTSVTLLK